MKPPCWNLPFPRRRKKAPRPAFPTLPLVLIPRLFPFLFASLAAAAPPEPTHAPREERQLEGWTLRIDRRLLEKDKAATTRSLRLLGEQLRGITKRLPAEVVTALREVPLYLSPTYPDTRPRAEYHPNESWLREHGRDPAMAKAVEFTNLSIFEEESVRMPDFVLHELAHAWHHRHLPMGYGNPEVRAAFEKARSSGIYDRVERRNGRDRSSTFEKAYALTNPMEYFAEGTEAFFGTNDFFPFDREELKAHDPALFSLLEKLWRLPG